jgi:hypothetical protein
VDQERLIHSQIEPSKIYHDGRVIWHKFQLSDNCSVLNVRGKQSKKCHLQRWTELQLAVHQTIKALASELQAKLNNYNTFLGDFQVHCYKGIEQIIGDDGLPEL